MKEIQAAIRSIIVNDLFCEIPESEIGVDDGLRTVLALDSLGFLELRVTCEQQFGIEISEDDFTPENFTSIRSISDLVLRLRETQLETT
ncbi:acyl carrier protein [Streptomyces winkii]|uniref:acyl carrier protein n=1 Tax=Streptomyces winkii TaxID=3051178 RepID=UPI0028D5673F|nr:acyl carrier protein [Streptomyces sp. DSM 40971]